jgi:hypothetical protein
MLKTTSILLAFLISTKLFALPAEYFAIQVVDDQTNRGVPLVQLETTNNRLYFTDSAGMVAFNEPGLMNHKVFFTVTSPGYEYPADAFKYHGIALEVKPGGSAQIKIKRINIAERLYRVTGQGIYRDTVLLGRKPPIEQPVLDSDVLGQDSVQAIIYHNKISWFWGDTNRAEYPLGNFSTTGATSPLPAQGGLAPSVGINLHYIADANFVKKMVEIPGPYPIWIGALMSVKDDAGKEHLIAYYTQVKGLEARISRGVIEFNDAKQQFEIIKKIDLDAVPDVYDHPFPVTVDGTPNFYFVAPYPTVRVKATYNDAIDLSNYESFTPLVAGSRYSKGSAQLDRQGGKLSWAWKKNTPPLNSMQMKELIDSGAMKLEECPFRMQNADDGKPILVHGGSVFWNDYRKKYIMIFGQAMGAESMLGEIWYSEAKSPEGPWVNAKKIATHPKMDLYNPTQHAFFDEPGGKVIYFEGTLANTFSGNAFQTPGYDYNQLMYRLDLSDPRLKMPE